jgi:trimeric autotransporter adhesin
MGICAGFGQGTKEMGEVKMLRIIAVSAITAFGGVLVGTATEVRADPLVVTGQGGSNSEQCPDGDGPTAIGNQTTAVGCRAVAKNQFDTAVGENARAISSGSSDVDSGSVALGANSNANATTGAIAIGFKSKATENEAIAIGGRANRRKDSSPTSGLQSIALGWRTEASGDKSIAIGTDAQATKDFGLAIGRRARVTHEGAVVIGSDDNGNGSDRANQFKLGQERHTYTLPGITSQASKDAQDNGPIEIVTTDQDGDLATMSMSQIASQQQVDQNTTNITTNTADIATNRDDIATNEADIATNEADIATNRQGVAIAIAMEGPDLAGNETFALAANWGTFEGTNAFAASATGVLSRDVFEDGSGIRLSASGGIGYSPSQDGADDSVAGRAGVQLSW